MGYLDNLLLSASVYQTVQTLQQLSWVLNLQKSAMEPIHHLEYLGFPLDIAPVHVFSSTEQTCCSLFPGLDSAVQEPTNPLLHEVYWLNDYLL